MQNSNYAPQVVLAYTNFMQLRSRTEEVETALNEAVKRHPKDRQLLTALGRFKLGRGDWSAAQYVAESLRDLDQGSAEGDKLMAAALAGQEKYDESIALLKEIQSDPREATPPIDSLVLAYIKAGKLNEAESFLATVLENNPKNAQAHVLRGLVKEYQKLPAEAEAAYRTAIESMPDDAVGYLALARYQIAKGELKEAEATLTLAREQGAHEPHGEPHDGGPTRGPQGLRERHCDL